MNLALWEGSGIGEMKNHHVGNAGGEALQPCASLEGVCKR